MDKELPSYLAAIILHELPKERRTVKKVEIVLSETLEVIKRIPLER